MFEKSNKYIVLSRNELFLVDATPVRQKAEKLNYSQDAAELEKIYSKIKAFADGRSLGVLMTDDIVYAFSSRIKAVDDLGKDLDENILVENKIRSKIPEDLSKVVWDFKSKRLDAEYKLFQIAVTNPSTTEFVIGLNKHNLSIDFVEPLSYALARNTTDKNDVHIIISSNLFQKCIMIADGGYVHFASTFIGPDFNYELDQVLEYASSQYNYDKTRKGKVAVYISEKENESLGVKIPERFQEQYELVFAKINIFNTDIVLPKEHHGKNDDVLNVVPKTEGHSFAKMVHSIPIGSIERTNYKLLGMIGFLIILIIVTAWMIISKNNEANVTSTAPKEISQDVQNAQAQNSANPNDEAVQNEDVSQNNENNSASQNNPVRPDDAENVETTTEFSSYKLLILNGSGFPGDASRVDDLFTAAGFSKGDLGNYPSGTVQKTTIRSKVSTPANILGKTADVLKDFDLAYSEDFLNEDSPYDIEVVVGETRKGN